MRGLRNNKPISNRSREKEKNINSFKDMTLFISRGTIEGVTLWVYNAFVNRWRHRNIGLKIDSRYHGKHSLLYGCRRIIGISKCGTRIFRRAMQERYYG